MDRRELDAMLAEGLSLAEIGRRTDRHESTISYWLGKHGLRAVGAVRHAARGGIDPVRLRDLVEAGCTIAEIAREVGRSKATVRHWLKEFDLTTVRSRHRRARARLVADGEALIDCSRHGEARFVRRRDGSARCARCAAEAVARRRRTVKRVLVDEAGGACALCGYDRCIGALHFHHRDPAEKRFALSVRGAARSLDEARAEAAKCVLLCSNCHAEVEMGLHDSRGLRAGP
jgi:transposase